MTCGNSKKLLHRPHTQVHLADNASTSSFKKLLSCLHGTENVSIEMDCGRRTIMRSKPIPHPPVTGKSCAVRTYQHDWQSISPHDVPALLYYAESLSPFYFQLPLAFTPCNSLINFWYAQNVTLNEIKWIYVVY